MRVGVPRMWKFLLMGPAGSALFVVAGCLRPVGEPGYQSPGGAAGMADGGSYSDSGSPCSGRASLTLPSFGSTEVITANGGGSDAVAAGDVNGDGIPDLLQANV